MGISSYENLTRNINQLGGVDMTGASSGDVLTVGADLIVRPGPSGGPGSDVLGTELTGFSPVTGTVAATDTVLEGFEKLQGSMTNLENKHVTTTRFATISSGTSGTITLPTNSTVKLDDFGGTVDAVITGITGGRPSNLPVLNASNVVVATTFDTNGGYVLSSAPSSYPVALVYRVTQKLKDFDSSSSDVHGEYEVTPTHDGLVGIGGGVAGNQKHYAIFSTTAQAKAATPTGPTLAFIEDKEGIYLYCTDCSYPADDDLVLITGNGGNTRWELVQKMSRTQGDTGWINTDNATLSKISSTQVRLSITSTAAIAIKGKRIAVPIGNYEVTLSGAGGPKFIGFNDATLSLSSQDTLWDFNTQVPVAVCYWSGTAIVASPQTEFHGIRDTVWHSWAHKFLGTQYVSGLSFTGNVQTDNNTNPGSDDTVSYLWSTAGVIQDEDVQSTPGTGQWLQTLGSGLTSTTAAIFNFFYFNGTVITTAAAMADRSPFLHSGTTPQWENAGVLTNAVSNDYIVYHYFASPMTGGWAVFARPHNAKYTSLALARAARPSQLTWSNYAELKHLYTAIFRVNTAWGNTHDCKLVALDDYRTIPGTPTAATAPTAHSSLSALELAGSGVTWGHIDDQAQTIAGVKTFDGGAAIKGATSAVAAGYVGERQLFTTRTLTPSAGNWVATSSSLAELGPGIYLVYVSISQSSAFSNDIAALVSINNNNDSTGSIVPGLGWETFGADQEGGAAISFQRALGAIYHTVAVGNTSQLYAKVYVAAANNTPTTTITGFAIRIA